MRKQQMSTDNKKQTGCAFKAEEKNYTSTKLSNTISSNPF